MKTKPKKLLLKENSKLDIRKLIRQIYFKWQKNRIDRITDKIKLNTKYIKVIKNKI